MALPERRLTDLYPALSARERAVLILQAIKADREPHPNVRRTMPEWQYDTFNHLMALISGVNSDLAILLMVLQLHLETLDAKFAWLVTTQLWAMQAEEVREYLYVYGRETITESGYAQRQAAARTELVPVDELAQILVERFEDWQPVDFEPGSDAVVSDAAWDRVYREKKQELVRLIQDGAIAGKRSRRGYVAQQGAFSDWLSEPTPVTPDWGVHYTVVPDDQALIVRGETAARDRLKEKLDHGPQGLDGKAIDGEDTTKTWEAIPRALARSLRAGILGEWLQVRAIELVIAEVAAEFGGEDPAKQKVRTTLRLVKAKLADLHTSYCQFVAPLEVIEPDEEELDRVREYLDWAEERLR